MKLLKINIRKKYIYYSPIIFFSSLLVHKMLLAEQMSGSNSFSFLDPAYDIVTTSTGSVIGHAPGIRTVTSIDKPDGILKVCSTLKVHYQILDKDGDWDRPFYSNMKEGTQNSITWWFKAKNSEEPIQVDKRSLSIDPDSESDQTQIVIPSYIKNALTEEYIPTVGGTLWYQIQPYTDIATIPDTSDKPLYVNSLDKAYHLEMAEQPGLNIQQNQFEHNVDFITQPFLISNPNEYSKNVYVPGLVLSQEQFFIKNKEIHESDCEINPDEFEVTFFNENDEVVDGHFKVNSEYKAEIKLKGRPINKGQLIDSQITWNLYQPKENSRCDITISQDRKDPNCFTHAKYKQDDIFEGGENRVINSYDQFDNLLFSKFYTQKNNNDAKEVLRQTQPNFSEQGYYITVSLDPK